MKISIAMATYNGERFLRAQLDSLSKQSRLPDELVVTDDSESSATFDILAEFSRSAPFAVRLYRNERRLGYRANFFKAMSLCTGDIIFPCDQDDVWQSEKISTCAPSFVDLKVLLVFHQMTIVSEGLTPCNVQDSVPFRGRYPALAINPFYFPPGMSLAVRADLVRLLDFSKVEVFDEKVFGHDSWLWTTGSSLGEVVVLKQRLLLYRQHSENVFGAAVLKGSKIRERHGFERRGSSTYWEMAKRAAAIREFITPSEAAPAWLMTNALRARKHYFWLEQLLSLRATLYQPSTRLRRLTQIIRMLKMGAYLRFLGFRALLKDVVLSLLNGRCID